MSEFKNVTVVKKANVYFDGKVTSRTVLFPDGTKKTLGVMLPGDYEFGTGDSGTTTKLGRLEGYQDFVGVVQEVCELANGYLTAAQLADDYNRGGGKAGVEGSPWTTIWHLDGMLDHEASWQGGGAPSYVTGRTLVAALGHDVETATDGADAVAKAASRRAAGTRRPGPRGSSVPPS